MMQTEAYILHTVMVSTSAVYRNDQLVRMLKFIDKISFSNIRHLQTYGTDLLIDCSRKLNIVLQFDNITGGSRMGDIYECR